MLLHAYLPSFVGLASAGADAVHNLSRSNFERLLRDSASAGGAKMTSRRAGDGNVRNIATGKIDTILPLLAMSNRDRHHF